MRSSSEESSGGGVIGNRRVSLVAALADNSPAGSPVKKTPVHHGRRVSLAPASGTFIRDKRASVNSDSAAAGDDVLSALSGPSSGGGGTPGSSKLRKMSQFFHVDKISETLLRDSEKEAFVVLHSEHEETQAEYKRLRSYVEQLKDEYERSRGYEAMTRYARLKVMIKRTVVHLKVSNVSDSNNVVKIREQTRRFEDRYESLTSDEIDREKSELKENISEFQQRIDTLVMAITDLEEHYNDAKRFFLWTRYQMMKAMVKDLIKKPTIVEII